MVAAVGLFVFIRVPETKGRSFDQIARILESRVPAYRIDARDFNDNFQKPDEDEQEMETFSWKGLPNIHRSLKGNVRICLVPLSQHGKKMSVFKAL